jgi:glycolate oxidase FAD binding subunit
MSLQPATVEELQSMLRKAGCLLPRGRGTKPALSTPPEGVDGLEMSAFSGIKEYVPGEFTFTALAGTPLAEVKELLAGHGQYLPFDPLLVQRGATLGGSVAAGISGPGRFHYGGLRDFVLGVRFVDSAGDVVQGGGKVVKNAAGFDLPKLMVGSLGGLGALVSLTFKVFPKPEATVTLRWDFSGLEGALQVLHRLLDVPLDLDALDLGPGKTGFAVWARLGGWASALPARLERLKGLVGGSETIEGSTEELFWNRLRELEWVPAGWTLVKVPLTPGRLIAFERELKRGLELGLLTSMPARRYSSAGQVAWLAMPEPPQMLDDLLIRLELSGLVLFGPPGRPRLGIRAGESFARRVKAALDPLDHFAVV